MCGLAGMAGNGIVDADVKLFSDLLYVTALRGDDATGLYTVNHKSGKDDLKKESTSADFFLFDAKGKGGILTSRIPTVYIGHCRAATRGALNKLNAHPFDVGTLVGAHNGTLTDSKYLVKDKTDSEMMFTDMVSKGVKDVLEGLDGSSAFAISVWDKSKKRLILARNDQRPLYIAIDKANDVMFWSSEQAFLEMVAARKHRKFEIRYLKPGIIYEIDVEEIRKDYLTPYKMTEIKLQPDTSWDHYLSSRYSHYPDQRVSNYGSTTSNLKSSSTSSTSTNETEQLEFLPSGVVTSRGRNAVGPEARWECDVCCESYRGPRPLARTFEEDGCKAYLCKTCAPWVKGINPRTKELSIKHNVS